jgi:hypothetical protein
MENGLGSRVRNGATRRPAPRAARLVPCRFLARNLFVLLFLLAAACAASATPACQSNGVQTWETFEEHHPLTSTTDLLLSEAPRTADCGWNGFYPYYNRIQAGFIFQPLAHLEIRTFYMMIINEPGTKRTHIPTLELNATDLKLGRWIVFDGNRMEEDFQPSGNTTRYTNWLQLTRPIYLGHSRFEPYVKGLAKYDLRYLGWAYTRAYAGVNKPLSKKLAIDGYFVRHFGSHLSPGDAYGVGVTFHARF